VDDLVPPPGRAFHYIVTAYNESGESTKEHPEFCLQPPENGESSLGWQPGEEEGFDRESVDEDEIAAGSARRLRRVRGADAIRPDSVCDPWSGFPTAELRLSTHRGSGLPDVKLRWLDGVPTFFVYRSDVAVDLYDPANLLGQTRGREWIDTPEAGDLWFYGVEQGR
jgi:hypothetical protein